MTTTHAFIGRCPIKGCGATARVVTEHTTIKHVDNRFGGYDVDTPAIIVGLPADYNRHVVPVEKAIRQALMPHCIKHQRQLRFAEIEGRHSDRVLCDARCQNAKGPKCECSCDGHNHGRAWG